MLREISLMDALAAFVRGESVVVLNPDELVALSLEAELASLKSDKVRFLADVPDVVVDQAQDQGKEEPMKAELAEPVRQKRKYTKKEKLNTGRLNVGTKTGSKPAFDPGKCQALINAGRDMRFLCAEFGMEEPELYDKMQKAGVVHAFVRGMA